MNAIDHKCPGCGAPLNFNHESQNWICNYCHKMYNLDNLIDNINKFNVASAAEADVYKCSNCDANLMVTKTTAATKCIYCGNSAIIKKNLNGIYRPDYIITFRRNRAEIFSAVTEFIKEKKLANRKIRIKEVSQVYVPCTILTGNMTNYYEITHFFSTDIKECTLSFQNVPVFSKCSLNNELLKGVGTYELFGMKPFEYPYLAGTMAECYDMDRQCEMLNEIVQRMDSYIYYCLSQTLPEKKNNDVPIKKNSTTYIASPQYLLVPLWIVKAECNGKIYEYYVNDQTKKISGIIPENEPVVNFLYILNILCFLYAFLGTEHPIFIIIGIVILYFIHSTVTKYRTIDTSNSYTDFEARCSYTQYDKKI